MYAKFIKPKLEVPREMLRNIIRDVIVGLDFLKKYGIIHCDLKPENILLRQTPTANSVSKLIDLGSAIFIDNNYSHCEMQTFPYRSPEIILEADYGFPIDMWSLGCIIYELITHKVLFHYRDVKMNMIKAMALNND